MASTYLEDQTVIQDIASTIIQLARKLFQSSIFAVLKGQKGKKGSKGSPGEKGQKGERGDQGFKGRQLNACS